MRFDRGVPELELESDSSLGRLTGGFLTGSLAGAEGRVFTMTVSLALGWACFDFNIGASSPDESEFSIIAAESTRRSFLLAGLVLDGDVFGTVALGFELFSNRFA
jgi:hypothetical protein